VVEGVDVDILVERGLRLGLAPLGHQAAPGLGERQKIADSGPVTGSRRHVEEVLTRLQVNMSGVATVL
jgi:hypothetical protein